MPRGVGSTDRAQCAVFDTQPQKCLHWTLETPSTGASLQEGLQEQQRKPVTSGLVSRYSRLLLWQRSCVRTPFSHHLNNKRTRYHVPVNEGALRHASFSFIYSLIYFLLESPYEKIFFLLQQQLSSVVFPAPIRSDPEVP